MTAAEVGSTANQYRILAKLAVGGMAEIFLARGASVAGVARYCVLKRILRDRAHDAQFVQMFLDEARLAAQLQHPNIASVYDVGMLGESYFFTMEYVHGETVRALLARAHAAHRPVPLACVLTVIAGAAAGLHHAHERRDSEGRRLGIVHRDVSPSNLMVSFEGNTKLVDFGVAKADDRAVETKSGTVKGKISYLSPEQCRGVRVDRRSDLFSLGIVMWELLTGHRLYRRHSDFENMTAIVHDEVPLPSSQRPDIPRAIDDIAMKLLAKDPAQRYQTADDVVEAIENASMRAGTILSTSAVARLLRDLFGSPPEPWLTLPDASDAAALVARPVPASLPAEPADPVEAELSGVPDLSPSQVMETEELPRAKLAAMAPPALPGLPPVQIGLITPIRPLPGLPPMPRAETEPPPALTPPPDVGLVLPPPAAGLVLPPPPASPAALSPTIIAAALPLGPFGGPRHRHPTHPPPSHGGGQGLAASTLLGVEPRAVRSGLQPPQLAQVPLSSQPLPLLAPSELATSSDMIALQQGPPLPPTTARRSLAPLAAVISLATIAGVATVWLAMRKPAPAGEHAALRAAQSGDAAEPDAPGAPRASSAANAPSAPVTPTATAPAAPPPDAPDAPFDAAPDTPLTRVAIAPISHPDASASPPEAQSAHHPAALTSTPPPPAAAPSPAAPSPAARPAAPSPTAPSSTAPSPAARPPAPSPATPPPAAPAPATPQPSAAPPPPGAAARPAPQPDRETLTNLFQAGKYAYVVNACVRARDAPEIARVCLMAACIENKGTQAQRWLSVERDELHPQLMSYCASKGTPLR